MFIEFGSARRKIALNLLRFSEMVVRKDRTCIRVNCGDMSNVVLFQYALLWGLSAVCLCLFVFLVSTGKSLMLQTVGDECEKVLLYPLIFCSSVDKYARACLGDQKNFA